MARVLVLGAHPASRRCQNSTVCGDARSPISADYRATYEDNLIAQADPSPKAPVLRILLADDNDRVRPMLSNIISQGDPGWEVCSEVANGQLAVERAAELKPDLVILDFSMPVLDGISAGRQIRAMLPHVPVLLYTFIASARIENAAKEAGIHSVIEKADFRKLIEEIRKLVPVSGTPPNQSLDPA